MKDKTKKERKHSKADIDNKISRKKKLKYGSIATAITVIVIVVVVLINVAVSAISQNKNLKLDLTSSKLYELSDDTLDYVASITTDVEIACTTKESDMQTSEYMKLVYETLDRYKKTSSHISLTFFDPTEEPDKLNTYQADYNGTISSGEIIVKSGSQMKVISLNDMFDIDSTMYQYYQMGYISSFSDCITGFSGEQQLTSAIMYVTDPDPKKVAVVATSNGATIYNTGGAANASAYSQIVELFDNNGYETSEVDIITDSITADEYDIIVLPAPQNDLTEDSISMLQDFLYNNGDYGKQLLYFADYTQSSTPNLDEFLETWGLSVDNSIVTESSSSNQIAINNSAYPAVSLVDDSDYSEGISNTSLPIVAPNTKPIDILWDANNERATASILVTSDTAYRTPLSTLISSSTEDETSTESETEFDADSATREQLTVMAAATKSTSVGTVINSSTVIAVGSMAMAYLASYTTSLNNGEVIINAMNVAAGKEDGIIITSKDLSDTTITITATQMSVIGNVVKWGIPLLVAVIGVVIYLRRKRK